MKNILLATIVALFVTGCASKIEMGTLTKPKGDKINITLVEKSENVFFVESYNGALTMAEAMYLASKKIQSKGFNYFAITSAGANNLNGFPINTIKDLYKYVLLHDQNPIYQTDGRNVNVGDSPLREKLSGNLQIKFVPLGDEYKNSYISVWDVKKTIADALAIDGDIKYTLK